MRRDPDARLVALLARRRVAAGPHAAVVRQAAAAGLAGGVGLGQGAAAPAAARRRDRGVARALRRGLRAPHRSRASPTGTACAQREIWRMFGFCGAIGQEISHQRVNHTETDRRERVGSCWKAICRSVAALALVASASPRRRRRRRPNHRGSAPDTFGIGGERLYDLARPARQLHARRMAELGVTFVRREAAWYSIEPEAPALNLFTFQRTRSYRWNGGTPSTPGPGYDEFGTTWHWQDFAGSRSSPTRPDGRRRTPSTSATCSIPPRTPTTSPRSPALSRRYGRNGSFWRAHPELDPACTSRCTRSGTSPTSQATGFHGLIRPATAPSGGRPTTGSP